MTSNRHATNTHEKPELFAEPYITKSGFFDHEILAVCIHDLGLLPNPTTLELIQYKEKIINYMLKRIRQLCDTATRETDPQKSIEILNTAISWLNPINHEEYRKDHKNRLLACICHQFALIFFQQLSDQYKSAITALQACKDAAMMTELVCEKSAEDYLNSAETNNIEAGICLEQLGYPDDAKKAFSKVLKNLETVTKYQDNPLSDPFFVLLSDTQRMLSFLCYKLLHISGMRKQGIQYAKDALWSIEKIKNKNAETINKQEEIKGLLHTLLTVITKPVSKETPKDMQELQDCNRRIKFAIINEQFLAQTSTSTPTFFSPASSPRSSISSNDSLSATATTAEPSPVSVQGIEYTYGHK